MARAGLGRRWTCLLANDSTRRRPGPTPPIGATTTPCEDVDTDLPGLPAGRRLAWASFPCQDLSLAGAGAGLSGARSGAFWGFHALMRDLRREGRAPTVIALENVLGTLTLEGRPQIYRIVPRLERARLSLWRAHHQRRAFRSPIAPPLLLVALSDSSPPTFDGPGADRALRRARLAPRRRPPAAEACREVAIVAPARAAARQSCARRLSRRRTQGCALAPRRRNVGLHRRHVESLLARTGRGPR